MRVARAPRALSIVFCYSRLPLPMTRADQMTVAHLLEFLAARGHRVHLFALDNGEPMGAAERGWLEARCASLSIVPHGRVRRVACLIAGIARGLPLQVALFDNPAQKRAARKALGSADLGYCYYIRSAEALRGCTHVKPTVLGMQLSQALNTRRMAAHYRNAVQRAIYAIESRLVRGYEAQVWRGFTRTVLIGARDLEEVRAACRERGSPDIDNAVLIPHGADLTRFAPRPAPPEPATLAFCGVLRTYTNVHAILWFADNVWPLIRRARPDARLLVIGRDPRPEVQTLGRRDGITVTGEVPEPADWLARAAVCIDPVQAAAGMQNKMLEFMAMAKPVVATPEANEGIGATPGMHFVTAGTAGAFAEAVLALLADPERAAALGRAARAFVEAHWSWEAHFLKLEEEMLRAVG